MSRARDLADSADLNFDSGTLVIDSANNRVGVGEEAPNGTLHVKGSSAKIILEGTNNGGNSEHYLGTSGSSEQDFVINAGSDTMLIQSDFMLFRNSSGSSEAARIDSSGNFLVGKTAFGFATVGSELRDVGLIQATRDGGAGLVVNRKTSDGELIGLYKDQSLVGSIGSRNAGTSFIALSTTSNTGLTGSGAAVCPSQNGGLADNAVDFGFNTARWKDLYLSGGVYLGGTGAANKLDDYEEGTFTPTVPTGMTGTLAGRYVKIGQMVFAHFKFASLDVGTSSGDFTAQLPFSSISNDWRYGGIVNELFNPAFSSSGTTIITPTIESGVLKIRRFDHNGGGDARIQTSVFSSDFLTIQVWYETAS